MSRLTTTPLLVVPSASIGNDVISGTPAWTSGSWVEFIAATSAPVAIAGVVLLELTTQMEIECGIGAAGLEVAIGAIRLHMQNSGTGGPTSYLIPNPISGIGASTRVSVRSRAAATLFLSSLNLQYYQDLDSDQAIPYTQAVLTSLPAATNSVLVTPSGTDFANSAWFEADPAVEDQTYLVGLAMSAAPADADIEDEIGSGAAGAEVALTQLRSGVRSAAGRLIFANLPGLYPVVIGTRVTLRTRKTGTSVTQRSVAILVYRGILPGPPPPLPPPDCTVGVSSCPPDRSGSRQGV